MQRISITNPQNIIDGTAKKYYFKLRNTGGPKGDKGDKGDTGATGPQGPQGNAATVSVGSTTTLPVGYDATVTNTGSIYNAVLDFGIPQGPQGPQGAKGDKGDTGAKGDTGPRGPQGERGTNATVYIGTTTTLNPGSQATVYNSGTDSNAVLNFGIPRGEKGETGATGATGATGPAGQDGQNFTPTVVAELPATGEESKLYLTPKAHTTQTATGNPITATVSDGAGSMESFQLDGDTFQQTYTGKNLLDTKDTPGQILNVTYEVIGQDLKITDTDASGNYHYVMYRFSSLTPGHKYTASFQSVTASSGTPTGRVLFATYGTGNNPISSIGGVEYPDNSYTFTVPANAASIGISFYVRGGSGSSYTYSQIMLEESESSTDFEPYVGGQASPSPDYPQTIQTVTGEQTVEIVGKNLFNATGTTIYGGYFKANGTISGYQYPIGNQKDRWFYIPCLPSTTYTITKPAVDPIANNRFRVGTSAEVPVNGTELSDFYNAGDGTSTATYTFTTSATANYLCVYYGSLTTTDPTNVLQTVLNGIQIEIGSATAYAPYSKQTYPINLGTIELCKLGTYQDYIYKDGDSWKVHKDTGKYTFVGTESWTWDNSIPRLFYGSGVLANLGIYPSMPTSTSTLPTAACNKFTGKTFNDFYTNQQSNGFAMSTLGKNWNFGDKSWASSSDAVSDVIGTTVYYALLSAYKTDTVITDQNLIAQLEAIRTASLENGANTITNTATGSNLAGDMEIGYYGYNPTNRYDKFIWLDINDNYEQIGE